jgi:hypothetical protein
MASRITWARGLRSLAGGSRGSGSQADALPAMRGNVMLEIHLAGSMTYAVDAVREEQRAA